MRPTAARLKNTGLLNSPSVVLQNRNAGFGYFPGGSRGGQVTVEEEP